MRKVTLHRETLRLVSSQATGGNMKEQGTAAESYWNTFRYCLPDPVTVGASGRY